MTWDVEAGVDVCHQLLGQGARVAENAAKEPQTGEVGPELQHICHPLPGCHGVQLDIGVADVYMFSGEVHICGQVLGDPNVGGQPFREYWNCVPSSIMVVQPSPLQSGHDVCSVDCGIVSKHLEIPHCFMHRVEGTPYLMRVSRDVTAAVREHFLLFSLPPLQVPLECLTPALFLFSLVLILLPLALLAISGLVPRRDENFFAFGVALASGMPFLTSV